MALINPHLLLAPSLFRVGFYFTLRRYVRELDPVTRGLREKFGDLNASLEESIEGIEVVKAYAQEAQERRKFSTQARLFRDLFVRQGEIQARYLVPQTIEERAQPALKLGSPIQPRTHRDRPPTKPIPQE